MKMSQDKKPERHPKTETHWSNVGDGIQRIAREQPRLLYGRCCPYTYIYPQHNSIRWEGRIKKKKKKEL